MQQNQKYRLFSPINSSSLLKPGADITHNPTLLPTVRSDILVCYASSG